MDGARAAVRRLVLGRPGDRVVAAAALVLLVVCAVFIPGPASLPLALVVAVLSSVPLAWRRVAPLPMLVIAVCAVAIEGLLLGSNTGNIGQFVVLLVLMFSFGAYARGRELPAGLLLALVGVYVTQAHDPTSDAADLVFAPPALVLLPFLAGRLLRRQVAASQRLHRLTVQLDRQREADAYAATLAERARIAREVHDVVAHSVGVMVVQAGAAEELSDADPVAARQAMAAVRCTGRDALGELRRLLGLLVTNADETVLAPQPGLDELDRLLEQAGSAGLAVAADVRGLPGQLPAGVDLAAYRVIQEALTNVRKHGGDTARLCLDRRADGVTIEVCDDGATPVPSADLAVQESADGVDEAHEVQASKGHGLVGMRERVALYGGTLTVGPRPSGGWQVRAWLPSEDV
jgi:signal transduction histidine kinase